MIWVGLFAFLGGLAGALGGVFFAGHRLPVEHQAQVSILIEKSPDEVWRVLADLGAYPSWRTDVTAMVVAPDGLHFVEEGNNGKMPFVIVENHAPSRRVTRIDDESLPFGGTWTYTLTSEKKGTRVQVTENGVVRNIVFRFVSYYVMGHEKSMKVFLSSLSVHLGGTGKVDDAPPL